MSATHLYRSVREEVALINAEEARAACLSVPTSGAEISRSEGEHNSVLTLCR